MSIPPIGPGKRKPTDPAAEEREADIRAGRTLRRLAETIWVPEEDDLLLDEAGAVDSDEVPS
jgi:hypothetical protein